MRRRKIRLTVGETVIEGSLADNAASRDFASLLPLTLTLSDYNATEKISDLPSRLSTTDAPEGLAPAVGDITYYAPWGNLAIFYRDFGYSRGLVKLGEISTAIESVAQIGDHTPVRIELTNGGGE